MACLKEHVLLYYARLEYENWMQRQYIYSNVVKLCMNFILSNCVTNL